jgi:hypothetical protein
MPTLLGMVVFACTFAGALLGMWLRTVLPAQHVDSDSRDSIKTGIVLIATMSALVLGLITASAKSSYDNVDAAVRSAVDILTFDRLLARYGPETGAIRASLKQLVARRVDAIWPSGSGRTAGLEPQGNVSEVESLIENIRQLTPHNPAQENIRGQALTLAESMLKVRWMVAAEGNRTIPLPFLAVLLLWLTLTFTSFGRADALHAEPSRQVRRLRAGATGEGDRSASRDALVIVFRAEDLDDRPLVAARHTDRIFGPHGAAEHQRLQLLAVQH